MPTTEAFTAALADAWVDLVKPHVIPNACILAARLTVETARYFGVTVMPVAVHLNVANDDAFDLLATETPMEEWPETAWTLGWSDASVEATGWNGHLVVVVGDPGDEYVVDLSAYQFDRPHKHITTGAPLVAGPGQVGEITSAPNGLVHMLHIALPEGHYLFSPAPENTGYKTAPDWRTKYKVFAGPMIRHLRTRL